MQTLRLVNEQGTVMVDLIGGLIHLEGGFDFATPGQGGVFTYEPYGAQFDFGNFQPQTETFSIAIKGNAEAVIAELDRLQDFLELIRLYNDGDIAAQSCWLEWVANKEEPKRTLLYSGSFKVISRDNVTPGLAECTILGTLSLTRHPLWESWPSGTDNRVPYYDSGIVGPLDANGDKNDYAGVDGNVPARISQISFSSGNAVGTPITEVWMGIRSEYEGAANFEPLWDCEDGTNISADTANAADATAYGGSKKRTTFAASTALVERFNITVAQVCAAAGHTDYDHQWGRYLVLARCKLSGAGTVGIQMHWGYTGNYVCEEIYIDNTSWFLVPLGNISIPPWKGYKYGLDLMIESFQISIYAELLQGAISLDMDHFTLIPNEHFLYVNEADLFTQLNGGVITGYANVITDDDDTEIAIGYDTNTDVVSEAVTFVLNEWYLPPGDGTQVIAAQRATGSVLLDAVDYTIYWLPRWTLYRGE